MNDIEKKNEILNDEKLNLCKEWLSVIENFNITGKICSIDEPVFPKHHELLLNEMSFFKVEQLLYDDDYPRREAFENVLRSLDNYSFNFVYVLTGTGSSVELCIGIVKNKNDSSSNLSPSDHSKIIRKVLEGNFDGSKLKQLRGEELKLFVNKSDEFNSAGMIQGIPSMNQETQNGDNDFQGIDRLINSMLGEKWRLIVVCQPLMKSEVCEIRNQVYDIYNKLAVMSKVTMQKTNNYNLQFTKGKNVSYANNEGKVKSNGKQESDSYSTGVNVNLTVTGGISNSTTLEITNKKAQEIMKYIDEEYLKRLNIGMSKGLYSTSVYYMADNPDNASRLKSCLMSLCQGDESSFSPIVNRRFDKEICKKFNILKTFQNHIENREIINTDAAVLNSRPFENNKVFLSTLLTAKEVSLYTGIPQTEVPGIVLNTGVDFGVNETIKEDEEKIKLGNIIQKGRELEDAPLYISQELLSKHTFIAGVTGSGKTTTCHRIIDQVNNARIPFMIIEPAKTEYRTLINKYSDLMVFTLGNESLAPIRINPFELIEGEIISSHIDMLKATFTSAFPMEASMPQILEEAMYKCYTDKGWNVINNQNRKYGKEAWDTPEAMPIISELLENLKTVTKKKGFGDRLQAEYIGSLVSRLSNLTVGTKGCMLNCRKSVDFHYLVNHNIILELEDLKSPEDKALIMGLVLSRISAVIKKEHKENNDYKHITIVEEAHRLLTKPDLSDGGARKAAVETFADLLAEVRKYGEGLIIVDQIPNKLAPEVLKNTNTKIIHKILARDDKEVVGDTMLMDDKQKEFLSALNIGEAIVFTENTCKPVHIAVKSNSNTNEEEIKDKLVKDRFNDIRKIEFNICYRDLVLRDYMDDFYMIIENIRTMWDHEDLRVKFLKEVCAIAKSLQISEQEIWTEFVCKALDESGITRQLEERKQYLVKFFSKIYANLDLKLDDIDEEDLSYFFGFNGGI